jgi:hypothetical protein
MIDLSIQPLEVFHFKTIEMIKGPALAKAEAANNLPVIVIAQDATNSGQHTQVTVLPFNDQNADKETLPLVQKLTYFPKVVTGYNPDVTFAKQVVAQSPLVAERINNFFNENDGFDQEMGEFLDGFTNRVVTGYENNLGGFFGGIYIVLTNNELNEFNAGMGIA